MATRGFNSWLTKSTIDIIDGWTLGLSDTKKLELLALYVDTLLVAGLINHADSASLEDFIEEVFNGPDGTVGCCPKGPPGEPGEPGIPDDDDIKTRYDELLAPLEDLGSLAAAPDDVRLVKIRVPQEHLQKWINIMQAPDDPELPPPGTTISSITTDVGFSLNAPTLGVGMALVSAEGGPFIDAYLEQAEDIVCEHKPIRDTEFLESRTNINMQHGDHIYEFEIVPTE